MPPGQTRAIATSEQRAEQAERGEQGVGVEQDPPAAEPADVDERVVHEVASGADGKGLVLRSPLLNRARATPPDRSDARSSAPFESQPAPRGLRRCGWQAHGPTPELGQRSSGLGVGLTQLADGAA